MAEDATVAGRSGPRTRRGTTGGPSLRRRTSARVQRRRARVSGGPPVAPARWRGLGRVRGGLAAAPVRSQGHLTARARGRWDVTRDQLETMAALLDAGVRLEDAFDTLSELATLRRQQHQARTIALDLRAGRDLASTLRGVGAPDHLIVALSGGQRSGSMAGALRSAGELTGRLEDLRAAVRRAATYPAIILILGVVMLAVVAAVVVPPLERSFVDLGGELPRATRIVLELSAFVRSPVLVALVAVTLVGLAAARRAGFVVRAPRSLRRLPGVGRFASDLDVAVLARVTAMMLQGGVPFVTALSEAGATLPTGATRDAAEAATAALRHGRSGIDEDGLGRVLDPAEREMLRLGARTGLLSDQWGRVAERRSQALESSVHRVSSLLEPLLIVLVGAVVGGAVMALYLPTFRVLELL